MSAPEDAKDRAVYHTILSDMHRIQAAIFNLQSLQDPDTAKALREHFSREQNIALARLHEWKQRRPEIHRRATEDFQTQSDRDP
jgi:hypothetical protein